MANARPRRAASKVVHYVEDDVEDIIDDTDFVLEVNNQRRRHSSTKRSKASAKANVVVLCRLLKLWIVFMVGLFISNKLV